MGAVRTPDRRPEAQFGCRRKGQLRWPSDGWDVAVRLREEGADLRAVTVSSLLGAYDWNSLLVRLEGRYEPGVFDLRSPKPRPTALAPMIRGLAAERGNHHPVLEQPGWSFEPPRLVDSPHATCGAAHEGEPDGRPILPGGLPKHKLLTDEAVAAIVREVFRLDVEDGRSPVAIAKWLKGIKAGGRAAWQGGTVRDMPDRHIYVGIRIRGMERHRIDPETGCVKTERRPVPEWKIRRRRDLQIVPRSVWKAAQRLRRERAGLFPRGGAGRAEAYPATLLRPVCGSCGAGLILGRGGKYACWFCQISRTGAHGCRHKGRKAVGVLERAVLGAVRDRRSGEGFVERLLADANASLAKLAGAPLTAWSLCAGLSRKRRRPGTCWPTAWRRSARRGSMPSWSG